MVIQPTQAEKNRMSSAAIAQSFGQGPPQGPMKLYVGSLHLNITEEMLRGIFEPFGRIESLQMMRDETGRSRGYGFITVRRRTTTKSINELKYFFCFSFQFSNGEDAKKAMEQLNGFELAGRAMKVK